MSPWGRSGGIAPFDQLFERRESFPKGFSFWGIEMAHTPYVYRLIDRENDKRYIGSRYARVCDPSDLGVTYFTSSKAVSKLFRENPERFEKQIIVMGDAAYVRRVERSLLKACGAVLSDEFYNRHDTEIGHPDDCSLGGKAAVSSGQLASLRTAEHQKKAGKLGGYKSVSSGHLRSVASKGGKSGGAKNIASGHIKNLGLLNGRKSGIFTMGLRFTCAECGMVSTPPSIGRHQKYSKHTGVIK